ncbi:MAG TPA: type I DNA topoisomerase [Anaerolineales bacterium]|nr:type I DNA topoisomerase [Anaerolineales bacterium]
MTTLIVVESPTKAKSISKYVGLSCIVQATKGHLRDLPDKMLAVDIEHGFAPHYEITNPKIVQELRTALVRCSTVIIATDPDREGEAIAWHFTQVFKNELRGKTVGRAVFFEVTPEAVKDAIANTRQIDRGLVDAQQARRVLDRLVGYKVSPLLWGALKEKGLSAGRVQSVALRLVVERYREIQAFVESDYWLIGADLASAGSSDVFQARLWSQNGQAAEHVFNPADVDTIIDDLRKNAAWKVIVVERGTVTKPPPPPFTTSALQQEASKELDFDPRRTMRVAQQLFEGIDLGANETVGLITYHRTDSTRVGHQAQQEARQVIQELYGDSALPAYPPEYHNKVINAQEAHEAIRPTSVMRYPNKISDKLNPDQAALYSLIWTRFIASQMCHAVYAVDDAAIQAETPTKVYPFRAKGKILVRPGWLAALPNVPKEKDLPLFQNGARLDCHSVKREKQRTQPPSAYTHASLIDKLETLGIGRPSTYATIAATLESRKYVEVRGKSLEPTDTGMRVSDYLVKHFADVFDLDFTARMEAQLDEVAGGRTEWVKMIDEFWKVLKPRV